ncbi:MAG: prepilin-type N-terminal cleavage/methylation domain-containing protein [Candidatus Aminicenantes bacterium]|nr:prepilin-type N-terminal cleavage/methylation domain-containing protein [Candidatus Aminicenantes bacterium]
MKQNTKTGKNRIISPSLRQGTEAGFTLIEIMIVFTLIGILVAMGIPQYKYAAKRAREATLKENLFIMRKLLNQYCLDKGEYPPSLKTLIDEEYLLKIPKDPITQSNQTWIEVEETLTDEELLSGQVPGISDVRSGSEDISLDGTPYNTW